MAAEQHADEGRIAPAWQNRAAGRALRLARASMEGGQSKQAAFVARLERELGISLSVGAYSNYENGRRTVPAAVLIEGARIAGRSVDDLLSEAGQPEMAEWVGALGMSQRIGEIERALGELRDRLADEQGHESASAPHQVQRSSLAAVRREVERQGELLADVLSALDRAELLDPADSAATRSSKAEGQGTG